MSTHITAMATALVACLLASAGACAPAPIEPLVVHVSIPPQAGLVSRIAGDRASVRTLVPVGRSPHSFELTPRQMAELAASRVYFAVGLPFEARILAKLSDVSPDLAVIDTSHGIPRRDVEDAGPADPHDAAHGQADPHVWLDPRFAAIMAERIRDGLVEADPDEAAYYDANLGALLDDLDGLDREIADLLEPYRGLGVYVFHPAFGYFTDRYGLVQVPIEVAGKEPGIRDLMTFIDEARADGVTTIFVQKQFPARIAEAVAGEIGADVVALDPLDPDYLAGLRRIAESIRVALASEHAQD